MKKSFAMLKRQASERGLLFILLTLVFLAVAQTAGAQQQKTVWTGMPANAPASRVVVTVPTGPFVSSELAKSRLEVALKDLKQIMAQNEETSPAYIAAYRRYLYYTELYRQIEAGKAVPNAIADSALLLTSDLHGFSAEEALVERNAAINLLRP